MPFVGKCWEDSASTALPTHPSPTLNTFTAKASNIRTSTTMERKSNQILIFKNID